MGSRELSKKLNETGYDISRYRTIKLMKRLKLKVKQRIAYKVTTKRKHSDKVASNLLNQNFNPLASDEVWAGDITYLKTAEGWMYLAIVMDSYSRRIVGWQIEKHMTTDLISKALIKAVSLRQPKTGRVFHSDRGSQYTSKRFSTLLKGYGIRASMGDVGACWDNAVVERFFGSLKHDWILKIAQPTREHMKQDVTDYMKYLKRKCPVGVDQNRQCWPKITDFKKISQKEVSSVIVELNNRPRKKLNYQTPSKLMDKNMAALAV